MIDWLTNLRNFIDQKIVEQNLTISQLSEQSGVPITTLRKLYDRERHPRIETVVKLADFFECSIDEMLGIEINE